MFSKELRKLLSRLKNLHRKNKKEIFDIVLFGSSVRGKYKPEDIDIVFIFWEKVPSEKIKSILGGLKDFHSEYLFLEEIYSEPLWSTIISEGFSLSKSKFFHEILGMKSWFLFEYNLSNLNQSQKSKFSHAIFGRTESGGLLKELGGRPLGKGSVMVPVQNADRLREILDRWYVSYTVKKVLVF